MNDSLNLPSIEALKDQAKRLRTKLDSDGTQISHSRSLELLAHQYGYKDWNTFHAAIGNQLPPCPVAVGARVHGHYLGQAFAGDVTGVQVLGSGRFRITLEFDESVDVVTFESFSNFRKRVSCVIDRTGTTAEKTSDGHPQVQLDL